MGLLYDAVIMTKDKKDGKGTSRRSMSPVLVKSVTQLARTSSSRTTPMNLPGWLVK